MSEQRLGVTMANEKPEAKTAQTGPAPAGSAPAKNAAVETETMSYAGAQSMAAAYPQYANQIATAAKTAFLAGGTYAYA
jgi:MFS transporter, DHA2 family, multidrug resistance protein